MSSSEPHASTRAHGAAPERGAGEAGPDPAAGLEPYRRRLDELDERIARAFGERFDVCREIALFKREHDIPMMQPARVEQVRARYLARGAEVRLPAEFAAALFELLIGATCRMEDELIEGETSAEREAPGSHEKPSETQAPGARDGGVTVGGYGQAARAASREGGDP